VQVGRDPLGGEQQADRGVAQGAPPVPPACRASQRHQRGAGVDASGHGVAVQDALGPLLEQQDLAARGREDARPDGSSFGVYHGR
jgi:hypothetical protein